MVKITINVSNKELDNLEDFIVCWNLCRKHNATDASEEEQFRFTQTCRNCARINSNMKRKAIDLWIKLVKAYEKVTER
ncbi:hypothetical protein HY546_01870 [archaeon]|nr:hypothetical protein [archaeon]